MNKKRKDRSNTDTVRKVDSFCKIQAMASEISILCKKTVVSTKLVEPNKFHSLSVLDRVMDPCNLRIVFYYSLPFDTDISRLKKKLCSSFSEVLSSFPVVTGRLIENEKNQSEGGRWMIKCNDAGVRMVEARAKGSIGDWLQTADREQELKLICWEEMFDKPYFWSTFYVQLTEFEGGGIAIGLSCTHRLADASSATILMKAWSDANLVGKMITPPLFHPLPPRKLCNTNHNHELYTDLINHYRSSMEIANQIITNSSNEDYRTVTFTFTDHMVRRCIAMAQVHGIINSPVSTPFLALAALFWICVSKVKGKKEWLINMSLCLDMRTVLGLDKGFFGNCMVFNKVFGEGLKENVGLTNAAKAIEKVAGKMGNEGVMDLIEWLDEKSTHQSIAAPMSGPDLMCASWDNLDPYSTEFEAGIEPIRVSYYLERVFGEGQVLILPSPKGEGSLSRVVMVTLPKEQVVKLCEEGLILHFSPTILMGVD